MTLTQISLVTERQRGGRQLLRTGHQFGGAPKTKRSSEGGARWRVHRLGESSEEVLLLSFCPLLRSWVWVPLRPLRLHHRGPGNIPGAYHSAPAGSDGGRRSAVPTVRRLLHIHLLPVTPSLHHSQSEKRIHWQPAVPQHASTLHW